MKRKSWKTLGSSIKQKSKLKNEPEHIVKNIKELANKQPYKSLQKSDRHINRTIKLKAKIHKNGGNKMEYKIEEVERDYIEFRKEMGEE